MKFVKNEEVWNNEPQTVDGMPNTRFLKLSDNHTSYGGTVTINFNNDLTCELCKDPAVRTVIQIDCSGGEYGGIYFCIDCLEELLSAAKECIVEREVSK